MNVIIYDLDDTLFDTTGQLNGSYRNLKSIRPFPGVHEVLSFGDSEKHLVTVGHLKRQLEKIEVLGINRYFTSIFIARDASSKRYAFRLAAHKYPPKKHTVIAVGNRIDCEIEYANQLGFTTVLLKHGKYASLEPMGKNQIPHYTIKEFKELIPLLTRLHISGK